MPKRDRAAYMRDYRARKKAETSTQRIRVTDMNSGRVYEGSVDMSTMRPLVRGWDLVEDESLGHHGPKDRDKV